MKKSDEVRLYHKGKSEGRDDRQKKRDGVRVDHEKDRRGESSQLQRAMG